MHILAPDNSKPDRMQNSRYRLIWSWDRRQHSKRNSWQVVSTRKKRTLSQRFRIHRYIPWCKTACVHAYTQHSSVNKKYLCWPCQVPGPRWAIPAQLPALSSSFTETLKGSSTAENASQAKSQLAEQVACNNLKRQEESRKKISKRKNRWK